MRDFNYNRFRNELKVDIQFVRNKFIKKAIVITGLMILYSCVFLPIVILADDDESDKAYFYSEILNMFYSISLGVMFISYALSHMQEMRTKEGRINVLMRPSTTKEKFIAKSIIILIAPIVTFALAVTINESVKFVLSDVLRNTIYQSFFCYSEDNIHFIQSCFYVTKLGHPVIQIIAFVATILLSQAFCLYMSNSQQRFLVPKALICIIAFTVIILLILHHIYPKTEIFYGTIYMLKSGIIIDKTIILMLTFVLVEIGFTIFLWRKSYKIFKSTQVMNHINNK